MSVNVAGIVALAMILLKNEGAQTSKRRPNANVSKYAKGSMLGIFVVIPIIYVATGVYIPLIVALVAFPTVFLAKR